MKEFDDDDELTGIFNDLTPEDFALPVSSAFREIEKPASEGEESFATFIAEQIDTLRIGFALADGRLNPSATLTNSTHERSFAPNADETLREYLLRIKREAALMGAKRFFFSRETEVAVKKDEPELVDMLGGSIDDPQLEFETHMLWFAMRIEGDEREHRQGYLTIVEKRLGDLVEGRPDQPFAIFEDILEP